MRDLVREEKGSRERRCVGIVVRAFALQLEHLVLISLSGRTKRLQKLVFTASLLDNKHLKGVM